MGQEIPTSYFSVTDFELFQQKLEAESALLKQWFDQQVFDDCHPVAGCELEAWLIDEQGEPAAVNVQCLDMLPDEDASPELSQFNIELNFEPLSIRDDVLSRMHQALQGGWSRLREVARANNADAVCIGILPTVRDAQLTTAFISPLNRYYALNEQVMKQRNGEVMVLDIVGNTHLHVEHPDVMLESAATSFQMHIQVPQAMATRYLNASMIVSAPLVAISANSPYLFCHDLWEETRIPLFEQAVLSGGFHHAAHGPLKRITFGNDYVHESLWECFEENLAHYPVLLPHDFGSSPDALEHLKLHNGTIWRWNRPLVGTTGAGGNARPHLRIEQRVAAAGPTLSDMVANMAFYYGLLEYMVQQDERPEYRMEFAVARDNFYQAAHHGLSAHVHWFSTDGVTLRRLVLEQLLEQAWQGLEYLYVDHTEITYWLNIIEQRVMSEQTGAHWQRQYVKHHDADMYRLLAAYRERQLTDMPVHTWDL